MEIATNIVLVNNEQGRPENQLRQDATMRARADQSAELRKPGLARRVRRPVKRPA